MQSRIKIITVVGTFLLAMAGPTLSFAAHAPTTKHQCMKHKDMKWDTTSKHCVKKG